MFTKSNIIFLLSTITIVFFVYLTTHVELLFSVAGSIEQLVLALQNLGLAMSLYSYSLFILYRVSVSNNDDDNDKGTLISTKASNLRWLMVNAIGSYAIMILTFQLFISFNNIIGINLITDKSVLYWFTLVFSIFHFLYFCKKDLVLVKKK